MGVVSWLKYELEFNGVFFYISFYLTSEDLIAGSHKVSKCRFRDETLAPTVQPSSTNAYKLWNEMNNYHPLLSNHQTPGVRLWSEGTVTSAPRKQWAPLSRWHRDSDTDGDAAGARAHVCVGTRVRVPARVRSQPSPCPAAAAQSCVVNNRSLVISLGLIGCIWYVSTVGLDCTRAAAEHVRQKAGAFVWLGKRTSDGEEGRRETEMSFFRVLHYRRNYGTMHRWRAGVNTNAEAGIHLSK